MRPIQPLVRLLHSYIDHNWLVARRVLFALSNEYEVAAVARLNASIVTSAPPT